MGLNLFPMGKERSAQENLGEAPLETLLQELRFSFIRAFGKFNEILEESLTQPRELALSEIRDHAQRVVRYALRPVENPDDALIMARGELSGNIPINRIEAPDGSIQFPRHDTSPNTYLARVNEILKILEARFPNAQARFFYDKLANIFAEVATSIALDNPQAGLFPLPIETAITLMQGIPKELLGDPAIFSPLYFAGENPDIAPLEDKVRKIRRPIDEERNRLVA